MELKYGSLADKVKQTILDRVINGAYPPGTRLVELSLAREFGVSQAPIREALRELTATRLVEYQPRRGTYVRKPSQQDLAEIYTVRLALESAAAELAYDALHAEPAPLKESLQQMRQAAATQNLRGMGQASTEFHRAVVAASGNRLMLEIWDSLHVEARTMATLAHGLVDLHEAAEAHVPIIAAFETGTQKEAVAEVAHHQQEYSILPQDLA